LGQSTEIILTEWERNTNKTLTNNGVVNTKRNRKAIMQTERQ